MCPHRCESKCLLAPPGSRLVCPHRCESTCLLAPPGSRPSVRVPSLVTSLGDVCNARGVLAWRGPANPGCFLLVPLPGYSPSFIVILWCGVEVAPMGCMFVRSCPMAEQENKPALCSCLYCSICTSSGTGADAGRPHVVSVTYSLQASTPAPHLVIHGSSGRYVATTSH